MSDTLRLSKAVSDLHSFGIWSPSAMIYITMNVSAAWKYFRPWLSDRSQSSRSHPIVSYHKEIEDRLILDTQSIQLTAF